MSKTHLSLGKSTHTMRQRGRKGIKHMGWSCITSQTEAIPYHLSSLIPNTGPESTGLTLQQLCYYYYLIVQNCYEGNQAHYGNAHWCHSISFSRCLLQGLHSILEKLWHNQEKSFYHLLRLPLDQSNTYYIRDTNSRARWHLSY